MPVSFNPATFVEGGLIDDVDVEFEHLEFCQWDYDGKATEMSLFLSVVMKDLNNPDAKPITQYYSAGDLRFFQPSEDGATVVPQGDKAALNNNTNCAKFLASLVEAGVPVNLLEQDDIRTLVGLKCHVNRVAQPKRSGIVRTGENAQREATVLLVSRVIALPGQKVPATATKAKTGAGAVGTVGTVGKPVAGKPAGVAKAVATASTPTNGAAATSASGFNMEDPVDMLAFTALGEMLEKKGGSLPKAQIPVLAFQSPSFKDPANAPHKAAAMKRIFNDDFLSSVDGITYDGATVSVAA